jgi:serpin B
MKREKEFFEKKGAKMLPMKQKREIIVPKRKVFGWASLCVMFLILAACDLKTDGGSGQGSNPSPDSQIEVVTSKLSRNMSPDVDPAELIELAAGNSAFAWDFYQAVHEEKDGNLFYSPFSISIALAMTWAGARTDTEIQMANTLHYTLGQDRLHPVFNYLDLELMSRGETAEEDTIPFRLNIANSLWGQKDYNFLEDFLDVLAVNYGACMRVLDFIADTEGSRKTINDWVEEKTEDKIQDLLPQGSITGDTRLVLTNAIYFSAAWFSPFEEDTTHTGTFNLLDESQVEVEMMYQAVWLPFAQGDGYRAVEIPYDGEEFSMVFVVPDAGQFNAFEAALDGKVIEGIMTGLHTCEVTLELPKFDFESDFQLKQVLSDMGMPIAFAGGGADFSGINGLYNLYIQDVYHKAFVAINEAGTEAAAATAVVVGETSAPEQVTLTIDRPFIFFIRDIATETILFVGRVLNPSV